MSNHTITKNIKQWQFSDYTLDDSWQGYGFTRQAWKGRLISLLDSGSHALKAVADTAASIGIATLILAPGFLLFTTKTVGCGMTLASCYLIRASDSTKAGWKESVRNNLASALILFGSSVALVAVGIPASLLWRIVMIASNTLGMVAPEIGRKGRIIGKILPPALEMVWCLSLNPSQNTTKVSEAKPIYHHTITPLASDFTRSIISKACERLWWKITDSKKPYSSKGSSFRQAWRAASEIYKRYEKPFTAADQETAIDILLLNHRL